MVVRGFGSRSSMAMARNAMVPLTMAFSAGELASKLSDGLVRSRVSTLGSGGAGESEEGAHLAHGLGPADGVQSQEDVLEVLAHGRLRQAEHPSDLGIARAE